MKVSVLMENTAFSPEFTAEHGLSLYIETAHHKLLFDTGSSGAFAENAKRLGVDLSAVDLAVISHGHNDHGGGLARFLECNAHAPVYLRENAFGSYYRAPDLWRGLDLSLAQNSRFVFTGDSLHIDDELELCSCNGMKPLYPVYNYGLCKKEGDVLVPDDFSHEQSLMVHESGRRILISGCSHKGVCNLCEWLHPDILIGGFHFKDVAMDEAGRTALKSAAAVLCHQDTEYYTGHCTGAAQYAFLKEQMGSRLHSFASGQVFEV